MKVIYKCNSQVINEYNKNPFGDILPIPGDIVILGETEKEEKHIYEVLGREFEALKGGNRLYSHQICIINVKEIEKRN